MFKTYEAIDGKKSVCMANSSVCAIIGIWIVQISLSSGKVLTLRDVHHIPRLRKSLVSVKKLDDHGFKVAFNSQKGDHFQKRVIHWERISKDNIYALSINN